MLKGMDSTRSPCPQTFAAFWGPALLSSSATPLRSPTRYSDILLLFMSSLLRLVRQVQPHSARVTLAASRTQEPFRGRRAVHDCSCHGLCNVIVVSSRSCTPASCAHAAVDGGHGPVQPESVADLGRCRGGWGAEADYVGDVGTRELNESLPHRGVVQRPRTAVSKTADEGSNPSAPATRSWRKQVYAPVSGTGEL